jgi:hypothetical protein
MDEEENVMKKRTLFSNRSFVLLLAMLLIGSLSLSACGGGGESSGSSTTRSAPFLALSASGTGTFTDASNDASPNNDYSDITGATVAITSTDITFTITLRNLPATLSFNQAGVPLNGIEYDWAVEFDTNNDNAPDYSMEMMHAKDSNPPVVGGILANTDAYVYKNDTPTSRSSIVACTASISGNTITLQVLKSALPAELNNITAATKVRIFTYTYNSSSSYYLADFVE